MNRINEFFSSVNWQPSHHEAEEAIGFFGDERKSIREKFTELHWDQSLVRQEVAIDYLTKALRPGEYIHLIVPYNEMLYDFLPCDKGIWENAAKIIIRIGWPKIESIVVPLFMWLLDPNWPGSELVYNYLMTIPSEVLLDKMCQVENNPSKYQKYDYADLLAIFSDMREEM